MVEVKVSLYISPIAMVIMMYFGVEISFVFLIVHLI